MTDPHGSGRSAVSSRILAIMRERRRLCEDELPNTQLAVDLADIAPATLEQPDMDQVVALEPRPSGSASSSIVQRMRDCVGPSTPTFTPVEVAVGQRDSTPHDVFGAAERPSRVSWRDQSSDRSSLSAQFEDDPGQRVPPAPRVRTSNVSAPKEASSRAEEVSMIARLEATRLLDIVGEEHFRVAGGDSSRLSSPPEQRRETIINRLIGAGGKQGAANIRSRRGFQNWLRWLHSASTVGLVSAEEAKCVMPVMAEDIEALIHWLRLSDEGGAADSIRPGMEYVGIRSERARPSG